MEFEFSMTVDDVHYHIRTYRSGVRQENGVTQNPHKHPFMEFHWVFSGDETVILPTQDRQIRLTPGKILLIPGGIYHGVTTENGTVERLCFNFRAEAAQKENSPVLELWQNIDTVMVFEDPNANNLMSQCRQLRLEKDHLMTQTQQGLLLLSTALRLFDRISEMQQFSARENSNTMRQKWVIEEYIEENFTKDTGLEGLARALYLSDRQTRKLVKRFLGEDYKSIIIRRRMELAEIYLRDPEKSLEEIAWQVGYRSYSGFQLSFKKHFGCTPSQRRVQLQTTNI